jgi:hypothetical protein
MLADKGYASGAIQTGLNSGSFFYMRPNHRSTKFAALSWLGVTPAITIAAVDDRPMNVPPW